MEESRVLRVAGGVGCAAEQGQQASEGGGDQQLLHSIEAEMRLPRLRAIQRTLYSRPNRNPMAALALEGPFPGHTENPQCPPPIIHLTGSSAAHSAVYADVSATPRREQVDRVYRRVPLPYCYHRFLSPPSTCGMSATLGAGGGGLMQVLRKSGSSAQYTGRSMATLVLRRPTSVFYSDDLLLCRRGAHPTLHRPTFIHAHSPDA